MPDGDGNRLRHVNVPRQRCARRRARALLKLSAALGRAAASCGLTLHVLLFLRVAILPVSAYRDSHTTDTCDASATAVRTGPAAGTARLGGLLVEWFRDSRTSCRTSIGVRRR